jgi:hypothetical protein
MVSFNFLLLVLLTWMPARTFLVFGGVGDGALPTAKRSISIYLTTSASALMFEESTIQFD